jgi:hypothetical protein
MIRKPFLSFPSLKYRDDSMDGSARDPKRGKAGGTATVPWYAQETISVPTRDLESPFSFRFWLGERGLTEGCSFLFPPHPEDWSLSEER